VLKSWLSNYFYDFEEDEGLIEQFRLFTQHIMLSGGTGGEIVMAKAGEQLLKLLDRKVYVSSPSLALHHLL